MFIQLEPPDPSYPYSEADVLRVDLCEPDLTHPLTDKLPADAFAARFFVAEWNAFIHLAARNAVLVWTGSSV
jgi:hypothetical protein